MPLYEFECEACTSRFERIQKFTDANPEVCPTCGKGPVRKLPSSPAIQFKGSGFYITDYAKKSSSDASSGASASSSGGDAKSGDAKSGDSKSSDAKSSDSKSTENKSSDTKSTGSKS